MAVNLVAVNPQDLIAITGVKLAAIASGIKANEQLDLVLLELSEKAQVAAVYTQNAFCAAPVIVAKQHQSQDATRYCLINSGNANAGTGELGIDDALACCQTLSQYADVTPQQVLPFSTGVIGERLPVAKMQAAIPTLLENLAEDNWFNAAQGITTTDTVIKAVSKQIDIDGNTVTITGMAKGSGMIKPNMATMLAYIATDASVSQPVLQEILERANQRSFNRICVDGDTSTNDACVLMASCEVSHQPINSFSSPQGQALYQAILALSQKLAQAIVRDGEGATKFVSIVVEQGESANTCRQVADTIAQSPLVKTALFASDPNWGRILAAVGRSPIEQLQIAKVSIYLDDVCVIESGQPAASYQEAKGQAVMDQDEMTIRVLLGRGDCTETVWTCDLSYDYVKINAEYRS